MTQSETIWIDRRFSGPHGSGNGGYVAGRVANLLGNGPAEVSLRARVPLETALEVKRFGDGAVQLMHGDTLVCEARRAAPSLRPPLPPFDWALAERLRESGGGQVGSVFANCIVCGRDRAVGDGLQCWAERVPGKPGQSLSLYLPHEAHTDEEGRIRPEFVWGTLDCPGAWAAQDAGEERPALTGRLTAQIFERPRPGQRCLVVGWRTGVDGRKLHAGTALYRDDGTLCALAQQLWIVLRQ